MRSFHHLIWICILVLLISRISVASAHRGDAKQMGIFRYIETSDDPSRVSTTILGSSRAVRCITNPCYQLALSLALQAARLYINFLGSHIHFRFGREIGRFFQKDSSQVDIFRTARKIPRGFRPPRTRREKKLEKNLVRCLSKGFKSRCGIPSRRLRRTAGDLSILSPSPSPSQFDFFESNILACVTRIVKNCARRRGFPIVELISEPDKTETPTPSIFPYSF